MSLKSQLERLIKVRGPLSVASYMQQCLTHPTEGYYVTRDPLGARGDFTTSPEISQMFGELIGINIITQWVAHGQPKQIRLVELGPGRGTLMSDLLRASNTFKPFFEAIEQICLVEASPELQKRQKDALNPFKKQLSWFDLTKEVPKDGMPTFLVAHEFFDALPIHQYEKTADGKHWKERLITYNEKSSSFEFVLSPEPAQAMSAILQAQPRYNLLAPHAAIEVCPEALSATKEISQMLKYNKGGALVVDYGPSATIPANTFRAFKNHQQVTPLSTEPGEADLTADVDFRGLKTVFEKYGLNTFGPALQRDWLHRMGIGARTTMLVNSQQNEDAKKRISSAYSRLTDAGGMGKTYKVLGASTLNAMEGFS